MITFSGYGIKELLHYDPRTGVFTWLTRTPDMFKDGARTAAHNCRLWNSRYSGRVAGHVRKKDEYRIILINGVPYYAHRLAWLYMTGEWPKDEVDHRDTDGLNNKWENLREADRPQNQQNMAISARNTSGFKGVYKIYGNRWAARVRARGKAYNLGSFDTPEAAHAAYCEAAKRFHGEFSRVA